MKILNHFTLSKKNSTKNLNKLKRKKFRSFLSIMALIFLLFLNNNVFSQDTIKIMTYNLLNFTEGSNNRTDYFKTVIEYVNPDILVVQEMVSQQASDLFYSGVLNDGYSSGTFIDGFDSDNAVFLKDAPIIYSIPILQGWNLISVLSEEILLIEIVFKDYLNDIVIIRDAVGVNVYWPNIEIISFNFIEPKKTYLLYLLKE